MQAGHEHVQKEDGNISPAIIILNVSPPIADHIFGRGSLKLLVRILLIPVVVVVTC